MSKKIIVLLISVFFVNSIFAFSVEDVIADIDVKSENISPGEAKWLETAVAERLEANLLKYTNIKIVNSADQNEILKAQAESESVIYDSSLDIGQLNVGTHHFITTIRKTNGSYTITVKFTNFNKGLDDSIVFSTPKSNVKELYDTDGNAVDEITIKLCNELDIELSDTEKNILRYGELGLSHDQNISIYNGDINHYNTIINDLTIKIEKSSSEEETSRLIQERNLAEKKLNGIYDAIENEEALIIKRKQMTEKALKEEKLKQAEQEKQRQVEQAKKEKIAREQEMQRRAEQAKKEEIARKQEMQRQAEQAKKDEIANELEMVIQSTYKNGIKDFAESTKPLDMPVITGGTFEENCTYVLFGLWPQNRKSPDVVIDTTKKEKINDWICYKGNDGKYYVKESETSDLSQTDSNDKENYFQLMPIKWRVVSDDFNGGTLLIAENVLDSCCFYESSEKRGNFFNRIYPNDYSKSSIRAYLNSIDGSDYDVENYRFNGFLNRAFSDDAISCLKNINVEYSTHSGFLDFLNKIDKLNILPTNFFRKNNKKILTDKVFLLSKEDLENFQFTQNENVWNREPVDYAIAKGYSDNSAEGWWLRSIPLEDPDDVSKSNSDQVYYEGSFTDSNNSINRQIASHTKGLGVVPAIVVGTSLKEFAESRKPIKMPLNTEGTFGESCTYVSFGVWPQNKKSSKVDIDTTKKETINGWNCYEGSDGNYYIKESKKSKFKFFGDKEYYYQLMPIKWRVASEDFSGGKLLIAENILDSCCFYESSEKRGKHLDTVYPNDYGKSSIRAYLNSINGSYYNAKNFGYNGFLRRAFSNSAIACMENVDIEYFTHSGASDILDKVDFLDLLPTDSIRKQNKEFVTDKVFLLSKEELESFQYGKNEKIWKREPVDYAIAKGYSEDSTEGWWLRSIPLDEDSSENNTEDKSKDKSEDNTDDNSNKVYYEGSFKFRQISGNSTTSSDTKGLGVVPAIVINF